MPATFKMIDDERTELMAENARLRTVLKNLIDASGHLSPFGGEASVKAVRRAGKYMEALEAAQKELRA